MAVEPVASTSGRNGLGGDETDGGIVIERHDDNAVSCRWTLPGFSQLSKQRTSTGWLAVGAGQDCRLLIYPGGDSQALPGFISVYLQVTGSSGKWECFASYRLSILNQQDTGKSIVRDSWHRFSGKKKSHGWDSYGRFAADSKTGDNTSLGWNDFITMAAFTDADTGYMQDDTATFTAAFHVIKETCTFSRSIERIGAKARAVKSKSVSTGENFQGKFVWKIEHFTRLKDILKKRKITGLCVKSKRFTVGGRDCRLIVYPRGQSNPPNHLSMFLEVTDSKAGSSEWSCFVSHRLSVVNQKFEGDRAVSKESQNRYSKSAKDWGWREFLQLHTLFDQEAGFLVSDSVVFAAEVLVLKEVSEVKQVPAASMPEGINAAGQALHLSEPDTTSTGNKIRLHWRIENFVSFKDIMETRKIFSKFFEAGACELRIGVYESFDTLCIYLESDALASPERNFWVKYRIAVVNQRHPDRTEWKDSAICTKTWNNSVLQFMKVSEIMDPEAGHVHRDGVVLACEVLECCPWFEFADLDVYGNTTEEEADDLSTDPDELLELENGDPIPSEADEELFHSLLAKAGMHLANAEGDESLVHLDADALQAALRDKLLQDHSVLAAFLTGLRMYLEDPTKIKQLLVLVTPVSPPVLPQQSGTHARTNQAVVKGSCLMDMLMTVQALQYPLLDLLLDVMLMCCQHLIMLEGQSWDLNDTEEDDQLEEESASDNGHEADGEQSVEGEGQNKDHAEEAVTASSSTLTPNGFRAVSPEAPATPANSSEIFPQHSTSAASPSYTTTDACLASQAPPAVQATAVDHATSSSPTSRSSASHEPVQSADQSADESLQSLDRGDGSDPGVTGATAGSASGSLSESADEAGPNPRAEVEEVLRMALAWLRRADPYGFPAAGGNSEQGAAGRPPAGHKVGYLLSAVPRQYQPDIIMLLPKLLEPADHATAANLLIAHLAEATRLGAAAEALIRLPVLATLGLLTVDAGTAKKLLTAILNILDSVRVHELPSAAGLILKLASQSSGPARLAAVKAVRQKLRLTPQAMTPGVLDAFRLVVMQHADVALEIVEGVDRQCGSLAATGSPSQGDHAQLTLHVFDIELLLDLLRNPTYKAQQVFEKLVAGNMVTGVQVAAVLERRQLQHVLATAMPQLRATTLGSTFSDPAALHRLWGLPQSQTAPSDQVAPHHLAPRSGSPIGSAADQQATVSGSFAAAAAAPANFPTPVMPISNMGAAGPSTAGPYMRHTHKIFPGAAQIPGPVSNFPQSPIPQSQPTLFPATGLVHQHHDAAPTALTLMLQQVQQQHTQMESYQQQLKEQQAKLHKASKQAQEAASKATAQQQALQQQLAELETKLVQARTDSKAQVKGHNTGKKELEDRVRELESEIEWVRAERQDAQQAAQREQKQAQARIKEAEDAAARAKAARRDEMKKINRDKVQLTERLKEAEGAQLRLDGEVHSLKSAAMAANERHDASLAQMEKKLQKAHDSAHSKQEEASQNKSYSAGLERKLRSNQQYLANLESRLQHEIVKAAPLMGSNLDALPTAQLQQLVHAQEEALKRARSMLACRHSEEGAAAVATAAAHAVTGPSSPESLRTATNSRRDQVNSVASSLESVASATSGGSTRVSPGGMAETSSGLGTRSTSQSPAPHSMSMFYGGNAAGHSHFGQPAGASTGFPALGNGTFSSNGLLGGSGLLSNGSRHSSSNGLHHLW
ncbi:hypothetical protein WJX79_002501 [Trebouxia sp. C0005]